MIFHGTTVATNALLTGRTAKVALATTAGFKDVLGYRNGSRPAVYDLAQPRPRQLVRRRDRIEVTERLSGLGEVVTPLTEDEADRGAQEIAARKPEAVAGWLLFSDLDDNHARMLGEAIARRRPGAVVLVEVDLTGQQLRLDWVRERQWYELLHQGFTLDQIRRVIIYLQREIRAGRRNVGALKLSTLLQPDRFEEDLHIRRVRLEPPTQPAKPKNPNPRPRHEQERCRALALEQLRRLKQSLA